MFNVTGSELVIIFLVALVVLGPDRLPAAARTVGKILHQIREVSNGFQKEIKAAVDEVVEPVQSLKPNLSLIDNTATPDATPKPLSAVVPTEAAAPLPDPDPVPGWSVPPRPSIPDTAPGHPVAGAVSDAARAAASPPIVPDQQSSYRLDNGRLDDGRQDDDRAGS